MTSVGLREALAGEPAQGNFLRRVRAALEGDVFVVGGFPRDLLAGRRPADLDLAVTADPESSARCLAAEFQASPFSLDADRGLYRVVLAGDAIRYIDIGRRRGDIRHDLGERDFTADALAAPLLPDGALGELIDPFDGAADIVAKRLRLVAERALDDDPLRLLRGVRLATELEFEIEEATANAIRVRAALLSRPAAERQRDELVRLLATPRAGAGLRLLDRLGLLTVLFPEIEAERGVDQPKEHYYDVFDHSLETVAVLDGVLGSGEAYAHIRNDFLEILGPFSLAEYFQELASGNSRLVLTKLAALYHDVAKPETKAPDATGRIRFLGHPEIGAHTTAKVCQRLRFGARESRFVALLVEEHLRPTQLANPRAQPSDRAIYRFGRDLGDAAPACLVLSLADAAAAMGPRMSRDRWRAHLSYVASILRRLNEQRTAITGGERLVTGDTIMTALGLSPGPQVGRLLEAIDEAVAAEEVRTVEEAIGFARRLNSELAENQPNRAGAA